MKEGRKGERKEGRKEGRYLTKKNPQCMKRQQVRLLVKLHLAVIHLRNAFSMPTMDSALSSSQSTLKNLVVLIGKVKYRLNIRQNSASPEWSVNHLIRRVAYLKCRSCPQCLLQID